MIEIEMIEVAEIEEEAEAEVMIEIEEKGVEAVQDLDHQDLDHQPLEEDTTIEMPVTTKETQEDQDQDQKAAENTDLLALTEKVVMATRKIEELAEV
jgi:hypothetical protein